MAAPGPMACMSMPMAVGMEPGAAVAVGMELVGMELAVGMELVAGLELSAEAARAAAAGGDKSHMTCTEAARGAAQWASCEQGDNRTTRTTNS